MEIIKENDKFYKKEEINIDDIILRLTQQKDIFLIRIQDIDAELLKLNNALI